MNYLRVNLSLMTAVSARGAKLANGQSGCAADLGLVKKQAYPYKAEEYTGCYKGKV